MLYNLLALGLGLILNTKVVLHLEKINPYFIHTGISFKRLNRNIRFDYRSFNDNNNYITNEESRKNFREIFPGLNLPENFNYEEFTIYRKNIDFYKKDIVLGYTKMNLKKIIEFEKTLHNKYIIGIYDCRHYTNKLINYSLNKTIPIWNLNSLF